MTFLKLAEMYLAERIVSDHYAANMRRVAGKCPTITVEAVNRYLRRRSEERASGTVKFERALILILWKWGFESGNLPAMPRGILKIKARRAPTRAWTVEQLREVLAATKPLEARVMRSGARVGAFLRAWALLGYETGGRFSDLMRFTGDNLDGDAVSWTQAKTGDPIVRTLSPACLAAVRAMAAGSPDGRLIGWACDRRQAMRLMRQHLDAVGVGGSSKWLRRSGATHIEIEQPGKAKHHLGHRTPGLAEQNYIDWSQVRANAPRTPDLIG